jgi:hypothetical protein
VDCINFAKEQVSTSFEEGNEIQALKIAVKFMTN